MRVEVVPKYQRVLARPFCRSTAYLFSRDVGILSSPSLECLQLALRLTHVAVKIVEVSEALSLGASIGVGRVKSLVVLDINEDAILLSFTDQVLMFFNGLGSRFGNEYVNPPPNGVEGDGVMRRVWRENRNRITRLQCVDCSFVRVWI